MNRTIALFGMSVVLVTALAGGCATVGQLTGEEAATTGFEKVTWNADLGEINPPTPDRRAVYVQFNDATGRNIQMRNELREELTANGYQIVTNPDTAAYKLQVRLISFDRREAGDRRDGTGNILTATAAQGTRSVVPSSGGFFGVLVDGLAASVGQGVANRTEAKEWVLVANFTLAEFSPEGVHTTNHSATVNRTGATNQADNASGAVGGERSTTDGQSQQGTQLKTHWEYHRTLTASTTKWNLNEQEACDRLLPRLLKSAANALPSNL